MWGRGVGAEHEGRGGRCHLEIFINSSDKSVVVSWRTQYCHLRLGVRVLRRGSPCTSLSVGTTKYNHIWTDMVYRYHENTKYSMSHSPRCAARSIRSGPLIILACQLVMVELGLLDLGSCATPVVPELRGEGMREKPSLRSSKAPTRSTHTLVRGSSRSSRCNSPSTSICFPSLSG
jgi:hypothetical protein